MHHCISVPVQSLFSDSHSVENRSAIFDVERVLFFLLVTIKMLLVKLPLKVEFLQSVFCRQHFWHRCQRSSLDLNEGNISYALQC